MPAFNLKPTVRTFLSPAYTLGILENPLIPSQILDRNIQWRFPLKKHTDDHALFSFYPWFSIHHYASIGLLQIFYLTASLMDIISKKELVETANRLLEDGCYLQLFVDYYYIKLSLPSGGGLEAHGPE